MTNNHSDVFMSEVAQIARTLDVNTIEALVHALSVVRDVGGRLFLLGVGGSAGNCSHAVNDFRKLCGIEAYSPIDNVSELTARTNDEGWDTIFSSWLEVSKLTARDALFILSVGGGDAGLGVSVNLIKAVDLAKSRGAKIFAIVGKDTGYTSKLGDIVVVVPQVNPDRITPLSEGFQAIIWHCLVSHPSLQKTATKW